MIYEYWNYYVLLSTTIKSILKFLHSCNTGIYNSNYIFGNTSQNAIKSYVYSCCLVWNFIPATIYNSQLLKLFANQYKKHLSNHCYSWYWFYLFVYVSVCVSMYLGVYVSVYVSMCLYVYVSVCVLTLIIICYLVMVN